MIPHKAAIIATIMWPREYMQQPGANANEFFASRNDEDKEICRELVRKIAEAPEENEGMER